MLYFGFIVPYGFLLLFNVLIIYKATKFERIQKESKNVSSEAASRKKAHMTRTILFLTFLFIATSLPGTIITGYFYWDVTKSNLGRLIINLVDGVQFSFPAFNFFILFFTNKQFAQQVNVFLLKMKTKNQVSAQTQSFNSKTK